MARCGCRRVPHTKSDSKSTSQSRATAAPSPGGAHRPCRRRTLHGAPLTELWILSDPQQPRAGAHHACDGTATSPSTVSPDSRLGSSAGMFSVHVPGFAPFAHRRTFGWNWALRTRQSVDGACLPSGQLGCAAHRTRIAPSHVPLSSPRLTAGVGVGPRGWMW